MIKLKDIFEIKDSLLIAKNQTNWEKFVIPNKNDFSLSFIIDNLKFTINENNNLKYELFINSINFDDLKNYSTNSINTHISENKNNSIDKNYIFNNENKIISDFNKDIKKDIPSSDLKTKKPK